jgi:hypothetical protein
VREVAYRYACGAHGITGVSALVWDVARRARSTLLTPAEQATVDTTVRAEARRRFAEGGEEPPTLEDVTYGAPLPSYGENGFLHVDHSFYSFACYACSDGVWSSYTRSINVPAQPLPASARPYLRPPAVVASYLGEHPGVTIAGWSAVTKAAAQVLAAALPAP